MRGIGFIKCCGPWMWGDKRGSQWLFLLPCPTLLLRLPGAKLCDPVTFPGDWCPLIAVSSLWSHLSRQLYKESEKFRQRRGFLCSYLPSSGRLSTSQTWISRFLFQKKLFYFLLLHVALNENWRLSQRKLEILWVEGWSFPTSVLL